jgi:transposase-like protein
MSPWYRQVSWTGWLLDLRIVCEGCKKAGEVQVRSNYHTGAQQFRCMTCGAKWKK